MPATAVTITPGGWLTDVDLGDPDLRSEHLRKLIGCVAVHALPLATDLLMWVADNVDDTALNAAATDLVMTTTNIPNQTIYGVVVCTGPTGHHTDITQIPDKWAQYIANHHAVRPIDTAIRAP